MASPLPESWTKRIAIDAAHVWHPFTQMKEHQLSPPVPVIRGEGPDLVLRGRRRVLDGVSSWWTSVHGHGHPRLVEALIRQTSTLDHELGNFLAAIFRPLLLHCERLEVPDDPRREVVASTDKVALDEARDALRSYFAEHGATLVAFIVEPLVQGAGGMRMWPPELLHHLRRACAEHGVDLVFDGLGAIAACNLVDPATGGPRA